jgi:hypothetical protein
MTKSVEWCGPVLLEAGQEKSSGFGAFQNYLFETFLEVFIKQIVMSIQSETLIKVLVRKFT